MTARNDNQECGPNRDVSAQKPDDEKAENLKPKVQKVDKSAEIGGRDGLDPVRYGDWEKNGRCIDF